MALADVLRKHDISFKKSLGQNLLLDDNINRIMVDAAALSDADDVVEVGAGLGALTKRMAGVAHRLLSIEIDRAFMPVLEEQFASREDVKLFRGDVLNHSVEQIIEEFLPEPRTLKMVSNLPYYITTPILFHFWESPLYFERFVVMVQQEVGERMVAPVGTADYGKLTLAAQFYGEVDLVHRVPRSCFKPQPKVDSVIVRIRNRREPLVPGTTARSFMKVVRAAFGQRRKTLRNSLIKSGAVGESAVVEAAFERAGINPAVRPQELTFQDFAALTLAIESGHPTP